MIRNTLVYRYKNIEAGGFPCGHQITVPKTRELCMSGCLAFVTGEQAPQALINAFIDEKPLGACEQKMLGFFQCL